MSITARHTLNIYTECQVGKQVVKQCQTKSFLRRVIKSIHLMRHRKVQRRQHHLVVRGLM